MFFRLAWRNIWRNPRRTLVLLTAIVIGVWSMIVLGALMRGMETGMIKNGIATLTGNIQIRHRDYRQDPSIDNSIASVDDVQTALSQSLPPEAIWSPRIRLAAIAANARHAKGITLVGVDPEKERQMSFIGQAPIQGRYLAADDRHRILIGQALADDMQTRIGKKLILTARDADGQLASQAFRIVGIYRAEMQSTEKSFAFVPLAAADAFLKMGGRVSEVSVVLPAQATGSAAEAGLAAAIAQRLARLPLTVATWDQMLPMLRVSIQMFDQFIFIWFLVTFVAMGFGIVNTTLMAVFERMREFGLLKALGLRPRGILAGVMAEATLLLAVGMLAGNLFGLLTTHGLAGGIDLSRFASANEMFGLAHVVFPDLQTGDLLLANGVVFVLGFAVSLYPAIKAGRITPVEALAHT